MPKGNKMLSFLARRQAWMRFFFTPIQRLVGVFLIFILLPGMFLGVLALRVLRQEEQLVRQRAKENLESRTQEIGLKLRSDFKSWEESVGQVAKSGSPPADFLPEVFLQAFEEDGGGIFLTHTEGGYDSYPTAALLYRFGSESTPRSPAVLSSSEFKEAETLETKQKEYPKAILAYRKLLKAATQENTRALLLQRLARTLNKAGRLDEASDIYRELQGMEAVWLYGLPADFIGSFGLSELAAESAKISELADLSLSLYRDLTAGGWLIDKSLYMYYSDCCRSWCRESQAKPDAFSDLQKIEERKLALTQAVAEFVHEPRRILSDGRETYLCFWQTDPFAAVLVSEYFLRSHWWHQIVSARGEDISSNLITSDGHILFGSTLSETPSFAVAQDVRIDGAPWRIEAWPLYPEAVQKNVRQRQSLYITFLAFIGAFLIFGSYITARIMKRELEISRMRADFVSTVSHEFRSPLTGIRHLGEMLLEDRVVDKPKQRSYFKMIVQESDRLTRLVENILDFSRMEEGRKEYRFKPLNTSVWLKNQAADFEAELVASDVDLESDIPEGLPQISADSEALGSAVHNLLDNAVKYSPGEKRVWISAEETDGEIRIAVRDEGVGISQKDRIRIFDRFYRAGGEISKRIKGAGLGLSLVLHVVEAHGGRIECKSSLGEGSTFIIRIPSMPSTGEE